MYRTHATAPGQLYYSKTEPKPWTLNLVSISIARQRRAIPLALCQRTKHRRVPRLLCPRTVHPWIQKKNQKKISTKHRHVPRRSSVQPCVNYFYVILFFLNRKHILYPDTWRSATNPRGGLACNHMINFFIFYFTRALGALPRTLAAV